MIFKQNSRRKGETVVLSSTIRCCTNCEMANHDSYVNVSLSQYQLRILKRRVFFLISKPVPFSSFLEKKKKSFKNLEKHLRFVILLCLIE